MNIVIITITITIAVFTILIIFITFNFISIIMIIIITHSSYYEKSDWSRASSQHAIADELDIRAQKNVACDHTLI